MKYQQLLFSRTENEDYRWIIIPEYLSLDDLSVIQRMVWTEDDTAYLPDDDDLPNPFLLINVSSAYILLRFSKTKFRDSKERLIYSTEGISVPIADAWLLRVAVSWILSDYQNILDVWHGLDFSKADKIIRESSQTFSFDFAALNTPIKGINVNQFSDKSLVRRTQIQYDNAGFRSIVQLLYPKHSINELKLIQVAFGGSSSIKVSTSNFEVFVPLGNVRALRTSSGKAVAQPNNSIEKVDTDLTEAIDFDERVRQLKVENKRDLASSQSKVTKPKSKNIFKGIRKIFDS